MLVPKHILEIRHAASVETCRQDLTGVYLERTPTGPRATVVDGHILVSAAWMEDPPADYPALANVDPTPVEGFSCLIDTPSLQQLQKAIPKKSTLPILQNGV